MTRARRHAGNDGFLLIETLATFTISAFVLLGLVTATSVLLHAVDRSVAKIESVDDLGRAMEAIRRDVAGLSRARWNGTEPQPFVFRGGPNSLYFAHAVTAPDGTRASEIVALREIVAPEGPTLVRSTTRLPARAASFDDVVYGPQQPLWTGAARLRFAYVPQREGHGEPTPRHDWPIGTKLPEAVLVEAVDRQTKRVLVTARIPIEANADIGCLGEGDAPASAPATGATAATASSTDVAPGAGGIDFGALPPTQPLPPPVTPQNAGAGAASDSGAFCGVAADSDDGGKAPDAKAPAAIAGGPQL